MKRFAVGQSRSYTATCLGLLWKSSTAEVRCLFAGATAASRRWASTTRSRKVRPMDDDVAGIFDDEQEEGVIFAGARGASAATTSSTSTPPLLSNVTASASFYQRVCEAESAANREEEELSTATLAVDGTQVRERMVRIVKRVKTSVGDTPARATDGSVPETTAPSESRKERDLVGLEAGGAADTAEEVPCCPDDPLRLNLDAATEQRIVEQQQVYYEMSVEQLTERVVSYLRVTETSSLVSAEEEHALFPVVLDRLQEFHISQLLDMVESHWTRSTTLRYGLELKDAVRNRIAILATTAATQIVATKKSQSAAADADSTTMPGGEEDDLHEDAIFVKDHEAAKAQAVADTVLAKASSELTAEVAFRSLLVMGMSAGRRKRDLAFFQLLGSYVAFYINSYKNPHQLVQLLTALARAKIVPSQAFLALIARRLPVLHKRVPLEPLPAYRAMANFARMGHDSMNTYRFLSDCMLASMEKNITDEKRERLLAQKIREQEEAKSGKVTTLPLSKPVLATASSLLPGYSASLSVEAQAKARLRQITGIKPSMFTKWLSILARFRAPHQQYLRPLIEPVILPALPFFPPPSFTRLLLSIHLFRSYDPELIDPILRLMIENLAPNGKLCRSDVLEMLRILSSEDAPVSPYFPAFLVVCRDTLKSAAAGTTPLHGSSPAEASSDASPSSVGFVLRPIDMCRIVISLGRLQRKVDIDLETLAPLNELVGDLAGRLAYLLNLSIVSLVQVDMFTDVCAQFQIPDVTGAVERLAAQRKSLTSLMTKKCASMGGSSGSTAEADTVEEEEMETMYYSQLDIDVRETFFKILMANDWNTYGTYRPLPGPMQVDFREELTKVTAFELLQAVDLYDKACPGALHETPRRYLTRGVLEKLSHSGELVVDEEMNELVLRRPRAELLTQDDLKTFTELIHRTPLLQLRTSSVVWKFIFEKAQRLKLKDLQEMSAQQLKKSAVEVRAV